MQIYPDYYKDFKCIGGGCKHNCCIGWEIDIDEESAAYYKTIGGELGERFANCISRGDEPHFILGEGERCPFLNGDNLCDIIIELGEESLCTICAEHPRFHNDLPGRVESGVGLACEEAARLILSKKDKMQLVPSVESDDEIIALRDRLLLVLQNRENDIDTRVREMLALAGATLPQKSYSEWAKTLLDLERLDENWTAMLEMLRVCGDTADFHGFKEYICGRETEYEQLLCYLIYRHFANAPDMEDAAARAAFAALGHKIIFAIGAVIWADKGNFDFSEQAELCRLFSAEIEYSDENLHTLFDMLYCISE